MTSRTSPMATLLLGLVFTFGSLIGGGVFWLGSLGQAQVAQESELVRHLAMISSMRERLRLLESQFTGLSVTVSETGKATNQKIDALKAEQNKRFDRLEKLLQTNTQPR